MPRGFVSVVFGCSDTGAATSGFAMSKRVPTPVSKAMTLLETEAIHALEIEFARSDEAAQMTSATRWSRPALRIAYKVLVTPTYERQKQCAGFALDNCRITPLNIIHIDQY